MNAKEKARDLVEKYKQLVPIEFGGMAQDLAKQCAIIAVDEILRVLFQHYEIDFYKEVKSEIDKL